MRRHYLAGLFVSLVAPFNALMADQHTPAAEFNAGIAAYQKGDFQIARQKLEKARSDGLASASLTYNLAVVYYRLGEYERSEREFLRLLDTPHAPLARYNLGLVSQARGDVDAAKRWFTQASSTASTREIQALANRQLEIHAADANNNRSKTVTTVAFLSVAAGYDDNIESTPSAESSDKAGAFGDLLASGTAYFPETERGALKLDATAYSRQYPNNANFDNTYLSAGAAWQSPLGGGRLDSGLRLTGLWFGGELLERQARLQFDYQRPECLWLSTFGVDCRLSAYAAKAFGGPEYRAYDGNVYGAVVGLEHVSGPWSMEAVYRLDVDRRDDLRMEQEFFSLSPTRHRLSAAVGYLMSESWRIEAEQSIRMSRYADPHQLLLDGQITAETRDDDQYRTTLRSSYQLSSLWALGIELSWLDNESSIERYDYARTEGFVSLDAVF